MISLFQTVVYFVAICTPSLMLSVYRMPFVCPFPFHHFVNAQKASRITQARRKKKKKEKSHIHSRSCWSFSSSSLFPYHGQSFHLNHPILFPLISTQLRYSLPQHHPLAATLAPCPFAPSSLLNLSFCRSSANARLLISSTSSNPMRPFAAFWPKRSTVAASILSLIFCQPPAKEVIVACGEG